MRRNSEGFRPWLNFALWALLVSIPATTAAADLPESGPHSDPLFARMAGRWDGEGQRVYAVSGRVVQVRVVSEAQVVSDESSSYLISRNTFSETDQRGTREYVREYWIRRNPSRDDGDDGGFAYELGAGPQKENRVTAQGRLEEDVFRVDQVIPTQPPVIVRSETRFFDDHRSVYRDTAWIGERQNVESEIVYVPAASH